MKLKRIVSFFGLMTALILGGSTATAAQKYQAGDTLAAFSAKDQRDNNFTFSADIRLVLVTFTMNPGKAANSFLEQQPADFLDRHHAIFLSNIYGMPGFVRAFVLPKMRKYPHRILLADSKDFLATFPEQEGKITVLHLRENGTIAAIQFADPEREMAVIFSPAH